MIEDELAAGFRWLRFKPLVERDFERNIDSLRRRHLCIASLIGVILFDLFVFNDRVMVPDVFAQALLYRLGIFTPIALVILALLASGLSMRICDYLGIFVGVLAVAIIMALYLQSTSPFKPAYHCGAVIIIIFVAVVQRLMFRHCVCAVAAMFVVSFIALYQSHTIDPTTFQADVTFHATVALLAVFTAYGLERELRRSYLLRMRSKFLNAQLDQAAKIDPLTGLFNRRHLNEIMAAAWAETGKTRRSMGVILIDIDHFKLFNDTQGHLAGDACLQRMSCCLRATFGDAAVRFGGEEFMIFIAGLDATRALAAAHLLRQAIHREAVPHPAFGENAIVTASIGVATGLAPDVSAAALMAAADTALYEAKKAGRDRVSATAMAFETPETMRAVA